MNNKYSKASVTGFSLIMLSVLIGLFFIFNDRMLHVLGRDVFDSVFTPLLICLFLTHIAGIVLSIVGLKGAARKKLKGKGFSIAGIVIFIIESVIIFLCFGLLFMVAIGGEKRPADPMPAVTTETTVKETKAPEFYENNEHLLFLKNNINEDMSLSEIIDVFEEMNNKMNNEMGNRDGAIFEAGSNFCLVYDSSAGEYVDAGFHFYYSLKRWFTAEDGERYQVCVIVMYKPDTEDYKYKDDAMSVDVYGKVNEDFFDDICNTDAYKYASSLEIERIEIFMGPQL